LDSEDTDPEIDVERTKLGEEILKKEEDLKEHKEKIKELNEEEGYFMEIEDDLTNTERHNVMSPCDSLWCITTEEYSPQEAHLKIKCDLCQNLYHPRCEGTTYNAQYICIQCLSTPAVPFRLKEFVHSERVKITLKITETFATKRKTINEVKEMKNRNVQIMGKYENKLEQASEKLGLKSEVYHGGDAMVGNTVAKIFKDVGRDDSVLLEVFEDQPDLQNKFQSIWTILSTCFTYVSKPNLTDEENESLAQEMEKFTFLFPIHFPEENITRKMHVFSMVLPWYVRKYKMAHLMLKLEQLTESMHNKLNTAENLNRNIRNAGHRLLNCIRDIENRKHCDLNLFQSRKRRKLSIYE
jgi:hypothetical protein